MTHPSHDEAWHHFDQTYPDFASDPCNIRLGLCAVRPLIVVPYNLPPEMCIKDPYLFLTYIIPGPDNPKTNIDAYLQILIDELNELWYDGVLTYDILTKQNFMLNATLMWTINNFPTYEMLFGWMAQRKLACSIYI